MGALGIWWSHHRVLVRRALGGAALLGVLLQWLLFLLLLAAAAGLGLLLSLAVFVQDLHAQELRAQPLPHPAAQAHRHTLLREARRAWGLDAPVAVFAAQIHQESRWNPTARSPVGAQGLAQFMPATAKWIGTVDQALEGPAPQNPTWALRALVSYDRWLWDRIRNADNPCERMAYTLAAYNGGLGWVYKRQRVSPRPGVCMGATCTLNPGITPAAQRENEHYPRVILLQHQRAYAAWGSGVCL